jgi:hypothetical protein
VPLPLVSGRRLFDVSDVSSVRAALDDAARRARPALFGAQALFVSAGFRRFAGLRTFDPPA